MANVTWEGTRFYNNNASTTNLSGPYDVPINSDLILIISVTRGGSTITAVTYNSVALTQLGTDVGGTSIGSLYYLVNPDTGSGFTASVSTAAATEIQIVVTSFYNVDQTTPWTTATTNTGTSTSASLNVNSGTGGAAIALLAHHGTGLPTITGSGNTEIQNTNTGNTPPSLIYDVDGNSTEAMTWTIPSQAWAVVGAGLNAVGAGGGAAAPAVLLLH